ncbi:restriction endonuclease subunit S [Escherichia coli]|nr:restriction endonuclease subunit S [Escherichia coli]NUE51569.1 restriction endonuclease subunit S [Escherichia coli]
MVPKGWSSWILSDICRKQISYGIVQTGDNLPNGIPCLRVVDLTRDVMRLEDMIKTSEETNKAYRKTILEKDEIVMALRGEIGLARLIDDNLVGANITRGLARISPETKVVLPEFLLWELRSPQFRADLIRRVGGSALQEISLTELRKVRTLLPPLLEQKKIAQILSTWDKAISVTEKLLTNSQRQKKALMQQLLTGKKRLLDENGVRFSGEWEYTIFGNLGDTYTGLTGKTKEDFGAGKPYIPYINIFKNSRIDIQNLEYVQVNDDERQSVVKYGDIFFTTSSETPEEVGMSSVLLEEVSEVFLNSFCFGFRLNNFETLIPKYARYLFRSEHVRRQISTLGQGATRYNLSKRQLIKLELKLPCVEEQQKIAAVLSAADAEISTLEKKLACLRDEKKALMQQLLTGKRRVKVDEAVAE